MKKLVMIGLLLMIIVACTPAQQAKSEGASKEPAKAAEQKPVEKIVLGAMFPLTGDGAAYGVPLSHQLELAVDEINANGGINGAQIELRTEDSKCNAKDGATAAQKLVEVDKVKVIFGGACSGETLGAAPVTEAAKVILISPSATSPKISQAGDYVFRTAPSDAKAGEVAANQALKMGFKKAAIISENSDYAQGLRDVFEKAFTAGNGTVVAKESYESSAADFKTQILKVVRARPDVVYVVPQTPAAGIQVLKQLKEQNVKTQLLTSEVLIGRDVVKEHGNDMEGLIGIEQAFDEKGPVASKALKAYEDKYGAPPWPFYQSATRDAAYLVANAVQKDGLDGDKIRDDLYATKDFDGAVGKLTLDKNGDAILGYSVKQVNNSTLVVLA